MRSIPLALLVGALGLLAGCSFDPIAERVNPYRIDVRQGNYVDQSMVSQLRKGMTREQVRFVLGTPLVVDPFRTDRWDYVYLFKPGRGPAERRVISVFFEGDRLDRVEGDVAAAADAADAAGQAQSQPSRVIEIPGRADR
ncbi:MAG TPA: outer membrane protein assembly factor BamE [Rhodocyclaceae bacterium]|nr:outer membrane protein assembly factor BamE [Rhodocyclaceae bacterium]